MVDATEAVDDPARRRVIADPLCQTSVTVDPLHRAA
jgi:hypothetical protein